MASTYRFNASVNVDACFDLGDAYFVDVGTPDALARASRDWKAVTVS